MKSRLPRVWTCIASLLLAACGRVDYEWQGPTENFRGLDSNSDGEVDRAEWEVSQGAEFPSSLGFRFADCDGNGRLTWHEYFKGYMRMTHCPTTYLYEAGPWPPPPVSAGSVEVAHEDDDQGEDWREAPLLARRDENVQIYALPPAEIDVPTVIRRTLPPHAAPYSEVDLTPAAARRIRLTSGALTDTLLVAHYEAAERIPGNEDRGLYPHFSCEIANDNADVRITMADVQVRWRRGAREYRARWLKPLSIEPRTAQHLDVWFGSTVDEAECRLLHVRGQATG